MGKHAEAEKSGECYNCGECVGADKLTVNLSTRWPVCEECDFELDMNSEE